MTAQEQKGRSKVPSAAVCADAAAWIARLHGEQRTSAVEEGFRRWLAASAEHRAAFDLANDIWAGTDKWPRPATPTFVRWPRAGIVLTFPRAMAVVTVAAAVLLAAILHVSGSGLATKVGEQRIVTLEDGTRVSLNTATRIRVDYEKAARRVRLVEGEALFEVAKRPEWPFVVTAGNTQVVAVGTSFVVRRDSERNVAVTLVEGKVAIAKASEPRSADARAPRVVLMPGERLTFAEGVEPRLDHPAVEQVTAWQRGQVILDRTPLAAAIDEMNRYSEVELTIDEASADLKVTGVFRTGDSLSFAKAVGAAYQLELLQEPRSIRLVQPIGSPSRATR